MTDAAAVSRARSGDGEAFRLLVDRHVRGVFRVAWRMTGNEYDADDLVQETLLRAWRQLPTFEQRSEFGTWLTRIAINCCLDFLRARERHALPVLVAAEPRSSDPQQDRLLLSSELREHVLKAMEELSGSERTAFILRHFEDQPINEIGSVLGLKRSATKHTVFRAVQKIRAALEPLVRSTDACDGRTARPARLR